jgi:hypothetical protein
LTMTISPLEMSQYESGEAIPRICVAKRYL